MSAALGALAAPLVGLNCLLTVWLAFLVTRLVWRVSALQDPPAKPTTHTGDHRGTRAAGAQQIDVPLHVRSIPPLPLHDTKHVAALAKLRADVRQRARREGLQLGEREEAVLEDDLRCCRYLVARKWDVDKAGPMLFSTLEWLARRRPPGLVIDLQTPEAKFLMAEGARGKIYCPAGVDRHGRGLLVFDNSVGDRRGSQASAMRFLAYHIDFALRQAHLARLQRRSTESGGGSGDDTPDKLFIMIKLNDFSLLNSPPVSQARETLEILMDRYPETMGHCIAYRPPRVFSGMWSFARNIIDAKMASKIVFINGSVDDGSPNDRLLRELCHDEWKKMLGCEQPVLKEGCSPGFEPSAYWQSVVERERLWTRLKGKGNG